MMKPMLTMRDKGLLDSIQMNCFQKKEIEELYEIKQDPFNIHNVANQKDQQGELKKLREILREFLLENPDLGQLPESKLISIMWPGNEQPKTVKPVFKRNKGNFKISTTTLGASIVYMISDDKDIDVGLNGKWQLYTEPISNHNKAYILAKAERIGFKTSELSIHQVDK